MKNSDVSIEEAMKNLFSAIEHYADDCKIESFEASSSNDFERSRNILDLSEMSLQFRAEVESLYSRWMQTVKPNDSESYNQKKVRTIQTDNEISQEDSVEKKYVWPKRNALGFEKADGTFVVKDGAVMANKPGASLKGAALCKYKEIARNGSVSEIEQGYRFDTDIVFASRAQATNVLDGYKQSAPRVWIEE